MSETIIKSYKDLQLYMGDDDVGRRLYKATQCGICFSHDIRGVEVAGYAEGADAECRTIRLEYPFTGRAFYDAVETADREGCALWDDWNTDC